MVSLIIDQADFPAFFAKTEICVVLAEKQTILSTACHHSIRLMVFFCYQIIDENADICLGAIQDQLFFSFYFHGCVDSCDQTLSGCFLVS